MKKKLFIPVETKVREFHGKLFFALTAAEKGFDVILGSQKQMQDNIAKWSPGIYMDKSISETKVKWSRHSRGLGNVMCSWDEEGLVVFDEDTYMRLRFCREVYDLTTSYFAWGPSEAGILERRAGDGTCSVHSTGNPRFDMLRPELRGFYDPDVEALKERYGRILLINTNFGFTNSFIGAEKMQQLYSAYSIAKEPGFFSGWEDAQRENFNLFKKMMPALRQRFPEHTIIIRPHPSENHAPWDELAEQLSDVVVSDEGNVDQWIMASEALIHFNCTTGIEAFFLGVPAISLRHPGHEAYQQPLPNQLSHVCDDLDSMLLLLDEIIAKGGEFPALADDEERVRIAEHHVAGMSDDFASTRVIEELDKLEASAPPLVDDSEPPVPLIKRAWRQVLRLVRRPDPRDLAYAKKKFPGVTSAEMTECIGRFAKLTGRFNSIIAVEVAPSCFRITSQ